MDQGAWLKRKQVCEILSISRNTFYSLILRGLLEAVDINKGTRKRKLYRVSKESLDRYLSEHV